ncbi:dynein regulatory complex subunit 7 [Fundulus heteroclitus]|uniref:dynein regulatory complex subunit 7 n=1 Tax=Fundulus heteroclitus TaxID=8078 RepID=UPI00165C6BBA|nr:dynein regulatory complex subunit 7 [Fundulus heteroclitus]XP_021179511.2 dynein regulatory complex subunit 7 [Fundulus heteroclitus]XP_021179513.2 dynein regulatory complex subunit 7 [Fundulus heteroclitus]
MATSAVEEVAAVTVEEDLRNLHLSEEILPESYRINSAKEKQLVEIADNFQRQYLLLYPDRKPLLLCPVNECGVRKFVSTTLRPTHPGLCELHSWKDCSSFVADFLALQPLEPPTEVPSQLFSPTSVLRSQKATCFESSTLLCSLLLGLDYDAYCVSGYASREICLLDQSLQQCPLLEPQAKSVESQTSKQEKKYGVRCQKELRSLFLLEQERKQQEAKAALLQEEELQEVNSRRVADPLRGLRVHCWVLVLSGKRHIQENFFIDPLTGSSFPTNDDNFQGIESVWNCFNCYVNKQECSSGCRDVLFDLEDPRLWEPVFHDAISQQQLSRAVQTKREDQILGRITKLTEIFPTKFRLLRPWVSRIEVSKEDLQTRFPGGKKATHYIKAKLERFSPAVTRDGLVSRLTTYKDLDCTEVTAVKEWYQNRSDNLEERHFNKLENSTTEHFKPRRAFGLLFHKWKAVTSGTEREMRFDRPELDGLEQRVVSPQAMEESFKDRDDFLYFRHVTFGQGVSSKPCPLKTGLENLNVLKVVERFDRNASKPANEDVAKRVFLVPEMQIDLTYHLMDHRNIPSTRSITKPKEGQPFTNDMFSEFQVDRSQKPLGPLSGYRLAEELKDEEESVAVQIKASLKEVEKILDCREEEEKDLRVFSSLLEQVLAVKQKWVEACMLKEDHLMLRQKEMEVLVPLQKLVGCNDALSAEEANSYCMNFLDKYKEKLDEHTSFLEQNLETLQMDQEDESKDHHHHHPAMSNEEAELWCHLCWDKKIQISAAQRRLEKHNKQMKDRCRTFLLNLQQNPLFAVHFVE